MCECSNFIPVKNFNLEKENEDLVKRLKEWEDLGHKYGVWCASRLDEVIQDLARKG